MRIESCNVAASKGENVVMKLLMAADVVMPEAVGVGRAAMLLGADVGVRLMP